MWRRANPSEFRLGLRTTPSWSYRTWLARSVLHTREHPLHRRVESQKQEKAKSGKQEVENASVVNGVFGIIRERSRTWAAQSRFGRSNPAIAKLIKDFNVVVIGGTTPDFLTTRFAAIADAEVRKHLKFHKLHTQSFPSTVNPRTFALGGIFGQEEAQQSDIQKIFMTAVRLLMQRHQIPTYNPTVDEMQTIMSLVNSGKFTIPSILRDRRGLPLMPLDPTTFRHTYFDEYVSRALLTSTLEYTGVYSSLLRIGVPDVLDYQRGIVVDKAGIKYPYPLLRTVDIVIDAHNYQRLPDAFPGKVTGNSDKKSLSTQSVNDILKLDHDKLKDQTVVAIGGGPSIAWLIREYLLHKSGKVVGKLVVGLDPKVDTNKLIADLNKLNLDEPADQRKAIKLLFPSFTETNVQEALEKNIVKAIKDGSLVVVSQTDAQTKITKTDKGISGEAVNVLTGKVVKFDSPLPVFAAAGNENKSLLQHVGKPKGVTVFQKQPQGTWNAGLDVPPGSSIQTDFALTQLIMPNHPRMSVQLHRFGDCVINAYVALFKQSGVEVSKAFFDDLAKILNSIKTTPTKTVEEFEKFSKNYEKLLDKYFPNPDDKARFREEWAKMQYAYQENIGTFVESLLDRMTPEAPKPL